MPNNVAVPLKNLRTPTVADTIPPEGRGPMMKLERSPAVTMQERECQIEILCYYVFVYRCMKAIVWEYLYYFYIGWFISIPGTVISIGYSRVLSRLVTSNSSSNVWMLSRSALASSESTGLEFSSATAGTRDQVSRRQDGAMASRERLRNGWTVSCAVVTVGSVPTVGVVTMSSVVGVGAVVTIGVVTTSGSVVKFGSSAVPLPMLSAITAVVHKQTQILSHHQAAV